MSKSEDKPEKTFWQTLPGIITSIAALTTAIGGCIAVIFGIPAISNAIFRITPTPIISQTTSSPAQTPYPTYTPSKASDTPFAPPYLEMNARLQMGQELRSFNGRFSLSLYVDGNLVLYDHETNAPIWASNTAGRKAEHLVMQEDGTLVLYAENGDVLWASETASEQSGRLYRFQINDDGNMVILHDGFPIWASNTNH
jgi:outer membrane protein assembly factor BamB